MRAAVVLRGRGRRRLRRGHGGGVVGLPRVRPPLLLRALRRRALPVPPRNVPRGHI